MAAVSSSVANGVPNEQRRKRPASKLVLCLDGTGNLYEGNTKDTNIVKLFQKLDRKNTTNQFHYYQPGIGTYSAVEQSINAGPWGRFKRWVSRVIDQAFGTTFDAHVIAAYRFIMRHYEDGDKIYIFGFSRGAYTARFLARMINEIGLLSKGNEEMIPFAYKSYQDYEISIPGNDKAEHSWTNVFKMSIFANKFKDKDEHEHWMEGFKETFCRSNVKTHFLGLFDTVNSVGYFSLPFTKKTHLPADVGNARYIRHAVAIDERRVKFKPALFHQDKLNSDENVKEVYFPGNHGDIGGGWEAVGDTKGPEAQDPVQLSDVTLHWMIRELQELPGTSTEEKLVFNKHVHTFMNNIRKNMRIACTAKIHNVLELGDTVWYKTMLWNFLEYLPGLERLEWKGGKWESMIKPNKGDTRDVPPGAIIHKSVQIRMDRTRLDEDPIKPIPIEPIVDGIKPIVDRTRMCEPVKDKSWKDYEAYSPANEGLGHLNVSCPSPEKIAKQSAAESAKKAKEFAKLFAEQADFKKYC